MSDVAAPAHFLCFHKQKTSARTRFLLIADRLLHAGPLPAFEAALGLPSGCLQTDEGFAAITTVSARLVTVQLAEFTTIDPPFAAAEASGGRFIALTDARSFPADHLALLRLAYEHILD